MIHMNVVRVMIRNEDISNHFQSELCRKIYIFAFCFWAFRIVRGEQVKVVLYMIFLPIIVIFNQTLEAKGMHLFSSVVGKHIMNISLLL